MADNAQVINSAYEAFASGDVPAVIEMVAEGASWDAPEVLPQGGSYAGPEGAGEFFQKLGSAWDELHLHVDDLIAEGEHVVGVGRAHGGLRGGGEAGYGFTHVFTLDSDGKVTRFREYVDPDARLLEARAS